MNQTISTFLLRVNAPTRQNQQGFTLIELMIVVAIVGILAMVVYPSYVDTLSRTNRAEAKRELVRVANLQEQYFIDMREYSADMKKLGLSADPFITESGLYSIDATVSGRTFTLTATALGTQKTNDSDCKTLTIDQSGTKASSACWSD